MNQTIEITTKNATHLWVQFTSSIPKNRFSRKGFDNLFQATPGVRKIEADFGEYPRIGFHVFPDDKTLPQHLIEPISKKVREVPQKCLRPMYRVVTNPRLLKLLDAVHN